jgi:hypothetical protein
MLKLSLLKGIINLEQHDYTVYLDFAQYKTCRSITVENNK